MKKQCGCPEGFPIERQFVPIDKPFALHQGVVIRAHTGECPSVDEIVRFGV